MATRENPELQAKQQLHDFIAKEGNRSRRSSLEDGFREGQRVECRDTGEDWMPGTVTTTGPVLRVRADNCSEAFIWGEVRALEVKPDSDSGSDDGLGIVLQPGNVTNPLLTEPLAVALFSYLPALVRIEGAVEWVLRYTPKAHGQSLRNLYRKVARDKRTLLLVQDTEGHVFGGYAPEAWEPSPRFYGSGEAFVFSFGRLDECSQGPQPKIYPWNCKNSYFQHCDDCGLAMGGGNGGHAFFLAEDLRHGVSGPTETFGNPILASMEEFNVKDLEVWAFAEI